MKRFFGTAIAICFLSLLGAAMAEEMPIVVDELYTEEELAEQETLKA